LTSLRSTLTLVDAAVLAPVYRASDGTVHLIFVRKGPGGRHGGQIAFPGGKREPGDSDLLGTALREAHEEVGLERGDVTILAALPIVDTMTTGYHVAPFLGRLASPPPAWKRQESEIAEVLDVPIDALTDPDAQGQEVWHFPAWDEPRMVPFYRLGPYKLWGMTYRIVEPLLPRLLAGEWDI
jgi:8-oxo-dGTP pyrophosphatase MutT (NUDIX family)